MNTFFRIFLFICILFCSVQAQILRPENGHYYQYIEVPPFTTWNRCIDSADALGGYLATVSDSSENDFIFNLISRSAYLGGSDAYNEGNWYWYNEESWIYSNWAVGQPDNENGLQDYLYLDPNLNGKWADGYGTYPNIYVDSLPLAMVVEYDYFYDSIKVIQIPQEFTSIQDAIDAAGNKDTILIQNGIYTCSGDTGLDLNGKCLIIKSAVGPENTIIDCNGATNGILIDQRDSLSSSIFGLTIKNAVNGIYCINSFPKIDNCIITQNTENGILIDHASPLIDNCNINNNEGNGIFIDTSISTVTLVNSSISHNSLNGLVGFSLNNIAIDYSLFYNNGLNGIRLVNFGDHSINNCSVVQNLSNGIYLEEYLKSNKNTVSINQCIITFNGNTGLVSNGTVSSLNCSVFYGNESGNLTGSVDVVDLFESDPLFCDLDNGDFTLYDNSICSPENNNCGLLIGKYDVNCACCSGIRGNINDDDNEDIDISDLVYFVSYSFATPSGPAPPCFEEADLNADFNLDIADIVYLVTYMFNGGAEPLLCP